MESFEGLAKREGARMKPWEPSKEEVEAVREAIAAARQVQTFLWGEANGSWGLEEWLRMFRKRVAKLEEVKRENPHASVELRKRLLQTAALSVALIGLIDRDGVPWEAAPDAPPTNLPGYDKMVYCEASPTSIQDREVVGSCECWEGVNDREGRMPCEHERLVPGVNPFHNTKVPGFCRCGAEGPPWKHRSTCKYD